MGSPVSGKWTDQWSLITDQVRAYMSCTSSSCCSRMVTAYFFWKLDGPVIFDSPSSEGACKLHFIVRLLQTCSKFFIHFSDSWWWWNSLNAAYCSMGFPVSGNWTDQWSLTTGWVGVRASCVLFCFCCNNMLGLQLIHRTVSTPRSEKNSSVKAAYWSSGLPIPGNWMDQWSLTMYRSIRMRAYAIGIAFIAFEKTHKSCSLAHLSWQQVKMHLQCITYLPKGIANPTADQSVWGCTWSVFNSWFSDDCTADLQNLAASNLGSEWNCTLKACPLVHRVSCFWKLDRPMIFNIRSSGVHASCILSCCCSKMGTADLQNCLHSQK